MKEVAPEDNDPKPFAEFQPDSEWTFLDHPYFSPRKTNFLSALDIIKI